ncbi:uncharacterized protein LOC143014166 [Genypterus blacodes]|uniref:uncharacterized protein LOC143014166 n=1 Tax=Genypterus blacodes TaxID=154954 RepID=UPI003F75CF26
MASASYTEDLTCSVCLTLFTDPVSLLCGHSFCRNCITVCLSTQDQCPQCRTNVPTEEGFLPTNHILKSLAEKAKEAEKRRKEKGSETAEVSEWFCEEHEEKFKLFCVTEQQLACVICRDGERHEGHKFKPIKEAAVSLRAELEGFLKQVSGDIHEIESKATTQKAEITKTQERSNQLMTQVSQQFEEMYQFMKKKEEEIKHELKKKEIHAVEEMSKSLNDIERALSESRELEEKMTSVLEVTHSERFLKNWTEDSNLITAKRSFKQRGNGLQVISPSLSLGPYESHLQFFVWKEMLQVIKPQPEELSLTCKDVSVSGRSLFCIPTIVQTQSRHSCQNCYHSYNYSASNFNQSETQCFASAGTSNQFTSEQHYWEIEVGQRDYWELGVQNNFLKYDGKQYSIPIQKKALTFAHKPEKIGVYLNCSSREISFYDADNMEHIHTHSLSRVSMPVSAYCKVGYKANEKGNLLTVCKYLTDEFGDFSEVGVWCFQESETQRSLLFCQSLSLTVQRGSRGAMAAACYMEDLTCFVCQTLFTDPVTLLCGHSFCRECITRFLNVQHQCPQCQTAVAAEEKCLPTSHILKNLTEKAKEAQRMNRGNEKERSEASEWLCHEHQEKLKLFCVTDQELACIICRDGERHDGHKFKPIKEVAASLKQELKQLTQHLSGEIKLMADLANTQREEITKTKDTSRQLMTQISNQFGEMHRFLRKREGEMKNELKEKENEALVKMHERLRAIEAALSESREQEVKVTSVLEISDSECFLKGWTEGKRVTPEQLLSTRTKDLPVVSPSLSLGPYESHLQFFVWKEMLQMIKPLPEQLLLRNNKTNVILSYDGRSLFSAPVTSTESKGFVFASATSSSYQSSHYPGLFGSQTPPSQFSFGSAFGTQAKDTHTSSAFSSNEFTSGQHYWETDVGQRAEWELGVSGIFLKYAHNKYTISNANSIIELTFAGKPRKFGVYLNCPSREVSFYDADNMRHIHTVTSCLMPTPVFAYFSMGYCSYSSLYGVTAIQSDNNPLTLCWY